MEQQQMMDALVQAKRLGNLLHELLDLTRQLADAIDRDDHVSTQLVLGMRQEPLERAALADQTLREQRDALIDDTQRSHFAALLRGEDGADPMEQALAERMAANRKTLDEICTINQVLSQKLSRGTASTG